MLLSNAWQPDFRVDHAVRVWGGGDSTNAIILVHEIQILDSSISCNRLLGGSPWAPIKMQICNSSSYPCVLEAHELFIQHIVVRNFLSARHQPRYRGLWQLTGELCIT